MITTSPKGATHAGRRIPKVLSREYFPGPLSRRAVEIAVFVTGSSAPPSVTQIGLPQWAFAVAMVIEATTPIGPKGLSSPSKLGHEERTVWLQRGLAEPERLL
jgi:hypothetical protein